MKNNYLGKLNLKDFSSFLDVFKGVKRGTITRTLMNQLIEYINIHGDLDVIDIGGGELSSYRKYLNKCNYKSINIDKKIKPDFLIKPNEIFPILPNTFDICLMFNLLEHIYDWDKIFTESDKVLKNGGHLLILIPFLYPIHGAPNDYKRVTHQYLKEYLINRGYNSIFINKFSYGPFSTSQLVGLNHQKLNCLFRRLSVTLDRIYQIFFREQFKRYVANYPLFYFVSAKLKK